MLTDLLDPNRLRDRDSDAWDALYLATCQRTYRVLSSVTGATPSVLEDLNQDVWLSAIESIEGFDATRGTASDWVLGIARYKGLSYLRKKYACRIVYVGQVSDLLEPITTRDVETDDAERAALLRGCIDSLPENWQLVLRQKYEKGLSVRDIAELVGATPKSIESTLSRARQRLRELFQETFLRGTNE